MHQRYVSDLLSSERSHHSDSLVVTLKEAASVLGLHPSTLRHQIDNGSLRATKRGRDWWITPREVERYREENKR